MTIALNAPVFATNYTVNATPNIQTRETLEIENGEEQKGGNTQNNKPETRIENPSKKSISIQAFEKDRMKDLASEMDEEA